MSDVVAMARAAEKDERLSDGALYGKLADEVERLTDELQECQSRWEGWRHKQAMMEADNARLRARNELPTTSLWVSRTRMKPHPVGFPTDLPTANDWIKQYRADNARLRDQHTALLAALQGGITERDRLRAALKEIASVYPPSWTTDRARSALEQKADTPSLQDMDDEIQASEREFRPMQKADTE